MKRLAVVKVVLGVLIAFTHDLIHLWPGTDFFAHTCD